MKMTGISIQVLNYLMQTCDFPDFHGIPVFQSSYILLEMNRSQSQLSVEL